MTRLAGQVALITGAGSGIGSAACHALANAGAAVALIDRNKKAIEAVAADLDTAIFVLACDVTEEPSVRQALESVRQRFGRLDIAINSAGIGSVEPARIHETTFTGWSRVIAVNLSGVYTCMKYELQAILAGGRGGSIVNISSMLGLVGQEHSSAYCAAKAGVLGLTRVAALEYARDNIRVNAVAPGYTETPMVVDRAEADGRSLSEVYRRVPMQRMATADEIASTILYLASTDSAFVTGTVIPVDGGYVAG